uniref:Sphingomyelin phosphodiesterase n=1 Tax=Strongyloides stercoralis TaxID=6248 RepID=A0AAF5D2I9_STRER
MEDGWNRKGLLQIPGLKSSTSTNSIVGICSICKKSIERKNLFRLSYQNANVSFSANCLSPATSKNSSSDKIVSCNLTNQNDEKISYINSNGRVLVKGATLDDASSPRVSSVSCQCHNVQMSHNSNCDWSTSHGNLIELSNRLHPQSNQIAQVSSDILRVSGYTNQYRHLLSGKSKRDSGSETYLNRQKSLDYDVSYWNKTIEDENILQNECKCISRKNSINSVILYDKKDERRPNTAILSSVSTALVTPFISSRCQSSNTLRKSFYSRAPMLQHSEKACNHGSFDIYHPKYIVRPSIPTRSFSLHRHYCCQSPDILFKKPSFKRHCTRCCLYNNKEKSLNLKTSNWFDSPIPINNLQMDNKEKNILKYEKKNGEIQIEASNPLDQDSIVRDTTKGSIITKKVKRRKSGYGIAITSDSTAKMRFRHRKLLFEKRNHVCDLSLALALVGLVLIVIDSEITALNIINKSHLISYVLRAGCVLSTFFLLISLITYHRIEVHLALIDSGADDWRVALTTERIIKLGIELIVCACCPFPGSGTIRWPHISPIDRNVTMVQVPTDVVLSVPMFLRAYLLCRFMVLHSKQFQDAATRSIAALNRISMDFRFVIKTMMANHPLRVLVVFTCAYWTCMSWMFTQCERYNNIETGHEHYYLNSLWFIMVTFMSIGYGDIVPTTYCGRMLSITTGIVGAGVSSALIAVISRKLELSRAEKHVNNFMADSKLTNQRKNAAASVLQQTWFIHKYQKGLSKGDDLRLRHHQRKFLQSINEFRKIKWDQRKLQEKGNSLLDVGKLHSEMHETLWEMHRAQDQFISQIDILTQKVAELQVTIMKQIESQKNIKSDSNCNDTKLIVPEMPISYCITNSVTTPDCSRTSSINDSPEIIHRIHSNPYIQMEASISSDNIASTSPIQIEPMVVEVDETGETTSLLQ